jgi:hypothetical protein
MVTGDDINLLWQKSRLWQAKYLRHERRRRMKGRRRK